MIDLSQKNDCMKESVQQIEHQCRFITNKEKRKLAYSFYQCHFKQSGRDSIECLWDKDVSECTKYLSHDHWYSYSMFYQHVDNLCIYYQNTNWQYETLSVVDQLKQFSIKSAEKISQNIEIMNDLYKTQQKMDENLKLSYLQNQNANNEILNQYIKIDQKNENFVKNFDSLQHKIIKQQENSHEFFTKIISRLDYFTFIQETFLLDFGGTMYFLIWTSILYTITSFKLFQQARGIITILLLLNILIEHIVSSIIFKKFILLMIQENDYNLVKLEILYTISAKTFKDYRKLNHTKLNEVLKKIDSICNSQKLEKIFKDSLNSIFNSLKKKMKFMTPKPYRSNIKPRLMTPKSLNFEQQEIPQITQ